MCQTNYTLLDSFPEKKKKEPTYQLGLEQITGCFRQLRILLRLSLLSEICHVELQLQVSAMVTRVKSFWATNMKYNDIIT